MLKSAGPRFALAVAIGLLVSFCCLIQAPRNAAAQSGQARGAEVAGGAASASGDLKEARATPRDVPAAEPRAERAERVDRGFEYGAEVDFTTRDSLQNARSGRDASRRDGSGRGVSRQSSVWLSVWASSRRYELAVDGEIALDRGARARGRFREIDASFSFTQVWKETTFAPALNLYLFPHPAQGSSTAEVSLQVSRRFGSLRPFVVYARDVGRFKGDHFLEIGVTQRRHLSDKWRLRTSFSLGRGSSQSNRLDRGALPSSRGALNTANLSLSWTYDTGRDFSIRPHIRLSRVLGGFRPGEDRTRFTVGVAFEFGA